MFCPSCGSEERQMSQYCRACGTDLRPVRVSLERPDSITASAASAREQIGRAVAEKIREVEDAHDLKRVAEDVLPQIEKFLESYEEKRLRRLRSGTVTALIGLAVGIPSIVLAAVNNKDDFVIFLGWMIVFATVTFATGLALLLNGLLFSKPRKGVEDQSAEARLQNLLDAGHAAPSLRPASGAIPTFRSPATSDLAESSVTEHTTYDLKPQR